MVGQSLGFVDQDSELRYRLQEGHPTVVVVSKVQWGPIHHHHRGTLPLCPDSRHGPHLPPTLPHDSHGRRTREVPILTVSTLSLVCTLSLSVDEWEG